MKDAGIACFVADENMSVLDGSIGILPRRILVDPDRIDEARNLVESAGLAEELKPPK
ncbi:putative signal transducing protein [Flavimaribacter sediminis]